MSYRPKGKHVSIDASAPRALGICDYTGFVFNRIDLVQQMEWRGNALVWNGFYVGRPYVDEPNQQERPPILPPDPVPVRDPRLQQPTIITWSGNYTAAWSALPVYDWISWSGSEDGIPCLPEDQRLALLQQGGNFGITNINNGSYSAQPLTQAQILQQLQQTHWGNS